MDEYRLRQIFYSLISEIRHRNKEEFLKPTDKNSNDVLDFRTIKYEQQEKKLNYLQIEFEALIAESED
jgi:hypothetical protein